MIRSRCLSAIVFGIIFMLGQAGFAEEKVPLALRDIETLLKNSVSCKRIVSLVADRGVSFEITDEEAAKLKGLGGNSSIIEEIKNSFKGTKKETAKETTKETAGEPGGSLFIDSEPQGADVFVNGKNMGKTPVNVGNIPAGKADLRVGGFPGYPDYQRSVEIKHDETMVLKVSFSTTAPVPPPVSPEPSKQ